MNKTDFITEVARKANVTKAEAERVMSAFEDVVVSALKADDKVRADRLWRIREQVPRRPHRAQSRDRRDDGHRCDARGFVQGRQAPQGCYRRGVRRGISIGCVMICGAVCFRGRDGSPPLRRTYG